MWKPPQLNCKSVTSVTQNALHSVFYSDSLFFSFRFVLVIVLIIIMCKYKTWDEVLAYPTVKIVKVKDRYLGGIRYIMLLAIFAYIIGYVIIIDQGYNECAVPDGSIELSLKKPPGMIDPATYDYCLQNPDHNISDALPCVVVDESDVYQPVDQTNAMYIITRYSQLHQVRTTYYVYLYYVNIYIYIYNHAFSNNYPCILIFINYINKIET